ncbi:NADAR family protein [Pseudomonas sp. KNUC1026]|uniref:NADAR family protein n=1 Tax=Pseudomonas sp. KNUC1026 TaxID=2893890 RepID=UPI001F1AAFF1|nr:NADAR domain-containing protein [Pseudomonas sp. KNUC1026]UFH50135.1 NADAR family protein [Pseudomonas sp. KNUC1026]
MRGANQPRFSRNPQLNEYLLQTGLRVIFEASPVDNIWGIGLVQDMRMRKSKSVEGFEFFGIALLQVRDRTSIPAPR